MFIPIRYKLIVVSLLLALMPLGLAGFSMITVAQDELKSAVNDKLVDAAGQLAAEADLWLTQGLSPPLLLLRNAVDSSVLGVDEKVNMLENGIRSLDAYLALQLVVEEYPPVLFVKGETDSLLKKAGIAPENAFPQAPPVSDTHSTLVLPAKVFYLPVDDIPCLPLRIPLDNPVAGQPAYLMAYVDLRLFFTILGGSPFTRNGRLFLLNADGEVLFQSEENSAKNQAPLQTAVRMLQTGTHVVGVESFIDNGAHRLGGYAITTGLPWAIVATLDAVEAYQTVFHMQKQLLLWMAGGLFAAFVLAFAFARHLVRPVTAITEVAARVGKGDLSAKVPALKTRDELALLGERINQMTQGLRERFHLEKFVSGGTLSAVKHAGAEGIKLGGERRHATVFFSDIRNFTAFSEKVGPETVIRMLNTYLRAQARIVKKYHGDIDKFVGDELVAVFQGEDMVDNAVLCACEIHREMIRLNEEHAEWGIAIGIGINSGDLIMGAMGSEERMDYTILGDTVNLGARLCSAAKGGRTLVSHAARTHLSALPTLDIEPLEPIMVKGKSQPIKIYRIQEKM